MSVQGQGESRYTIRVVDRALDVLQLLSDGEPRLLTQVSGSVGLHSTTTFRVLTPHAHQVLDALERLIGQVVAAVRTMPATLGYRREHWPPRQDG